MTHSPGSSFFARLIVVGWLATLCLGWQVVPCESSNFCSSNPNATGMPAIMSSNANCVVADNNFTLMASPVPNSPGLFFYSQGQANGGNGVPFGPGLRCVGGAGNSVFRLSVNTAMGNTLSRTLDFGNLTTNGSIFPGSTWNFQAWFRDTDAMGTPTFNLTDGLQVTFLDPLPEVEFSLPNRSVPEGAGTALVKVELSATSFVDVAVPFFVSGDAVDPDDYTVSPSPLVIPAGQLSADIVVTLVEDLLYEGDENVEFQLGTPVNGILGAQQTTVLKIQEDDPVPEVRFLAAASDLPEGGPATAVTVELSAQSVFPVSVPFTVDGTAMDPDDYSISSSPVIIAPGQTMVDIVITPVDDALVDPGETIVLTLGQRTNAALGSPSVHTVTLTDDDVASVEFDVAAQNVGEGAGATPITVNLSSPLGVDVMVSYTVRGSATDPDDYSIAPSPLTIPAGATSADIVLTPAEDILVEGGETVVVSLTGATNAALGATQVHTSTLVDNDVPSVEFDLAAQNVDEGAGATPITVNLSTALGVDVVVSYTVRGSATDPDDYSITGSPVTILAGQTSADISLTPMDDLSIEGDETVVVTLTGATNAGLGVTQVHTATLIDDDQLTVEFDVAAQDIAEGAGATGISVSLSALSPVPVSVEYMVRGSATDPDDYSVDATPLVIPAGQMSADIFLTPVDDALVDPAETVILTLASATNAALGATTQNTTTLVDDDVLTVEFDQAAQSVDEAAGDTGISVSLSALSGTDVMVVYAVRGSATDPDDYSIAPSPLTIAAGQMSADIVLTPVDDIEEDPGETVVVTLMSASGATLGTTVVHTATIQDDDGTPTIVSDDFNKCALDPIWTLNDPLMDATLETRGAGTDDAQLLLGIPAGTHTLFNATFTAPRVTQAVPDADFGMDVKLDSLVTATNDDQGIVILEDESNWIRFDTFRTGGGQLGLFAASTVAGSTTTLLSTTLGVPTAPVWLRVARAGDEWTLFSSLDGALFTQRATFMLALNVSEAGVYVGNNGGPAFTAVVDYVFETAAPIVPEDGAVIGEIGRTLTVNVTGMGSVARDPDLPLYYCSDEVSLTATPAAGWMFDRWEVDLTGSTNPDTVTMDDDRNVTAVFVQAPLAVNFAQASSSIGEAAGATGITVNLSAPAPAPVSVEYTVRGSASDPDDYSIAASPLLIGMGQMSADIVLTPVDEMDVDPGETVVVTLTSATGAMLGTTLVHTATLVDNDGVVLVSDDFNKCALDPIWMLNDPLVDATLETRGAGTDDAQLLLGIPAGTHDVFDTLMSVPRVTQVIPDANFEMEVKFDSPLVAGQDQGVLVLEDDLNWARFDFFRSGANLTLFAASTVAGDSTTEVSVSIGAAASPMWLRINRTGDQWTVSSSLDGMTFTQGGTFAFALNANEAGVYVGNAGPAHTAIVDYVFETGTPIVPEDGAVIGEIGRTLTVNVTGMGSVDRDPDLPLYYCSDDVSLTAIPAAGWMFDRWEVDLTGSANPDTVTMDDDRNVTAVFVQAPLTVNFAQASSSIGEAAGATGITVNLSAPAPAQVSVEYTVRGSASDPDDYSIAASPLLIGMGQMSADIVLTPVDEMDVDPGETVVVTLTSATGAMLGATLVHTATLVDNDGVVLVSDDFNKCALDPIWMLNDPLVDATLETRGAGTDDAQLLLGIPAGTHDVFDTLMSVPRVTQVIPDANFEMEVKFDSPLVAGQDQGVLVLEDDLNWARFDFFRSGANLTLFAASTVAGDSTTEVSVSIGAATSPMWLRINRTGDQWTVSSSLDGMTFTQAGTFAFALNVGEAGVYVGNTGPAHTAIVDYVFETGTPIVPEDGAVIGEIGRTLTVNVTGMGSVDRDPDLPLYYCSDEVSLTATPAAGWMFDRWEVDLTGSMNPDTVTMDDDRNVTAVFVQAPLTVNFAQASSSIGEAAGATGITVNLSAPAPAPVSVEYTVRGSASDPDDYSIAASPLLIGMGQMSADIVLTPVDEMDVDPGETVVITLTSAMGADLGMTLVHTATLGDNDGVVLVSDDFNSCALDPIWTLTDPLMDASLVTRGAGGDDAQLLLSVPAGSHGLFGSDFTVPRVTQVVVDADFEVEVKFDSLVTATNDDQGLVILEDESNWVRFDFFRRNNGMLSVFAASTENQSSTTEVFEDLGVPVAPVWLRVNRTGDDWTLLTSLDGVSFVPQGAPFTFPLSVTEAGVYVGNNSGPAFTAIVDYVFETGSPVVPEDGAVMGEIGRSLNVTVSGMGSVLRDPDQALYYCSDDVLLTAVPAAGWMFDRWEVDLTGSTNPDTVTMDDDRNVTAVFVPVPAGPLITDLAVTPRADGALVTWTTGQPATSVVEFGAGSLDQVSYDPRMVTRHAVLLSGLASGGTYRFQVGSEDVSGRVHWIPPGDFRTLPTQGL